MTGKLESSTGYNADMKPGAGRNDGVDLLRLVAAFYIVILHTMGRGGLLGRHLYISWFMFIWAQCAVNCFALISGYVGYRRTDGYRPKLSRYLSLWLEVVIYGVAAAAVYKWILPDEVTAARFVSALLPVSTKEYWYFTAYTGVFFVAPLIHHALQSMSDRAAKCSMLVLFLLFSVYATAAGIREDVFRLNEGYSFAWLAILYYLGAGMKKTGVLKQLRPKWAFCAILLLMCASAAWVVIFSRLGLEHSGLLIQYLSPTIVTISILYLASFSRIRIGEKGKKLIRFAAPGSFAVYLLNANPCFWDYTLHDGFSFLMDKPVILMPLTVLAFAGLFVVFAVSLDYLRRRLFAALRIDDFCTRLDEKLQRFYP